MIRYEKQQCHNVDLHQVYSYVNCAHLNVNNDQSTFHKSVAMHASPLHRLLLIFMFCIWKINIVYNKKKRIHTCNKRFIPDTVIMVVS